MRPVDSDMKTIKPLGQVVKFLVKLSVSIILMAWVLLYQVDYTKLFDLLKRIDIWLLLLAFILHFPGYIFSALRWQKLLESQHVHVKLLALLDSYIIGSFFNVFMPTRVGGDIFRVNDLRQASKSFSKSASFIFVERFLGMSILLFFALCVSLIRLPIAKKIPIIWFGLTVGILGLSAIIVSIFSKLPEKIIRFIPKQKLRDKVLYEWATFRTSVGFLISHKEILAWGLWYSLLLQLNVVIYFWITGEALGFDISLLDYFFLIPVQLVILMLPTINGIGLREVSSIVLFGFYGIMATEAAMFGFIDFAMLLVIGFIGWLRFMTRRSIPQGIEPSPEM